MVSMSSAPSNAPVSLQNAVAGIVLPGVEYFGGRYVPWHQEMKETTLDVGGKPRYLQWLVTVLDDLTTNSHYLEIKLPSDQLKHYLPTALTDNQNFLKCYWIPVKKKFAQMGFPIQSSLCQLTTSSVPYKYTINKPVETLPKGKYIVRIAYDEIYAPNKAALTFDISDSSNPVAQYSELEFKLVTSLNTYTDLLRINTIQPFTSITVQHNSLTASEYDYLFVNFNLPVALAKGNNAPTSTTETALVVDIRSEFYKSGAQMFQDFGFTTDPLMFLNEKRQRFINGESYPYKLYKNGVDATSSSGLLMMQFGQWDHGEQPIRFRLIQQSFEAAAAYQLRIPMLRNPLTASKLNLDVYLQEIRAGEIFPRNISSYKFVNYVDFTSAAPTSLTFAAVTEDAGNSNNAQSKNIRFKIALSNLVFQSPNYIISTDWYLIKWNAALQGVASKNLPLFSQQAPNDYEVNYFHDLTLFMIQRKVSFTAVNSETIAFAMADSTQYEQALYTAQYGLKYSAILRARATIRFEDQTLHNTNLVTLKPTPAIRYIKFQVIHKEFLNVNSVVLCELSFVTPKIPKEGYIKVILPADIKFSQSPLGHFCFPGKNTLRSLEAALECVPTSSNSFVLRGFAEIAQTNPDTGTVIDPSTAISVKFYADVITPSISDIQISQIFMYGSRPVGAFPGNVIIAPDSAAALCSSACDLTTSCAKMCDPNFDSVADTAIPVFRSVFNFQKSPKYNEWSRLQFEFSTSGNTATVVSSYDLTSSSQDKVQISIPTVSLDGSGGTWGDFSTSGATGATDQKEQYYQYRLLSNERFWKRGYNESDATTPDLYAFRAYTGHDLLFNTKYRVDMSTRFYINNGIKWPNAMGVYRFWLATVKANVRRELSYYDYVIENDATDSLVNLNFKAQPILNGPSQDSMIKLTFTGAPIDVTDEIWIEFETHNKIERIFDDDLGTDTFIGDDLTYGKKLSCFEMSVNKKLTNTQDTVTCGFFKGDGSPNVRRPALLKIIPKSSVAISDTLILMVTPYRNPSTPGLQTHITWKVMSFCRGSQNPRMCAKFTTYTYFVTLALGQYSAYSYPSPASQLNPGMIGARNTIHDFSINLGTSVRAQGGSLTSFFLDTRNFFTVKYPDIDIVLPSLTLCTHADLELCIVLPQLKLVMLKLAASVTKNSAIINLLVPNQNNGWKQQAIGTYELQVWDPAVSMKLTYTVSPPAFILHYVQNPSVFTIQSTQTQTTSFAPGYKYYLTEDNQENYVQIDVKSGLWATPEVKQFWIHLPKEIYRIDSSYFCNASLLHSDVTKYRTPYPPNLKCTIYDSSAISKLFPRVHKISLDIIDSEVKNVATTDIQQFAIRLYIKFRLLATETTKTEFSDALLQAWSQSDVVTSFSGYTTNSLIAYSDPDKIGIAYNTFLWPNLKRLTFNTKSFAARKAKIGDTTIQYYMIFQPKTTCGTVGNGVTCPYRIDKMIFTLPNSFGYPPIRDLTACSIENSVSLTGLPCQLLRVFMEKSIIYTPEKGTDQYSHRISIITISNDDMTKLFIAPQYPGTHYPISIQAYAGSRLVEKATINLTNVQGYDLELPYMKAATSLDGSLTGLFEFSFRIGPADVPAGYDSETFTTYSNLVFIFDTASTISYSNDIGTGQKNMTELGCIATAGIATTLKQSLTCLLKLGTGPEDLPQVWVSGYDPIKANTQISIAIVKLRALANTGQATISMSVKLIYKDFGGISSFFYGPRAYTPPTPTAPNIQTPAIGAQIPNVSYAGGAQILESGDYSFTFQLSTLAITPSDYFAVEFPADYFERYSDYSRITCETQVQSSATRTPCKSTMVFGVSNFVYMAPAVTLDATKVVTFHLMKLVSPAYKISGIKNIEGSVIVGRKINAQYTFSISRTVSACTHFKYLISTSSSSIGNENNVTYTIDFITGHAVPTTGAVSIQLPQDYTGNLYTLQTRCTLVGLPSVAICKFGSYNRIDIQMNGATLFPQLLYSLILSPLNNPPSSGLQFSIASYYDSNIYLDRQICQAKFNFPLITQMPVRLCDIFVSAQLLNINLESLYSFTFQCQENIRENTVVEILIPQEYQQMNPVSSSLQCKSKESTTLASSTCQLVMISNSLYLRATVRSILSQTPFTLQSTLFNPRSPGLYQFSVDFKSQNVLYAQAALHKGVVQYLKIVENQDLTLPKSDFQVLLQNVPKNAGEKAYYVFSIPPIAGATFARIDAIKIFFTELFEAYLGEDLLCGHYETPGRDDSFLNYKSLLSLTQSDSPNFIPLSCEIRQEERVLTIAGSTLQTSYMSAIKHSTFWNHFIIRNVRNPSEFQPHPFKIAYQLSSITQWYYQSNLVFFVSSTPQFIALDSITLSTNSIKVASNYVFNLKSVDTFKQLQQLNLLISIRLPPNLFTSVQSFQKLQTLSCQADIGGNHEKIPCQIYKNELILYDLKMQYLTIYDTFSLSVNNLVNPISASMCTAAAQVTASSNSNLFQIRIIDAIAKEIIHSSSPLKDKQNCVSYEKQLYAIDVTGSSILKPGLSYEYIVSLELPADNLQLWPSASHTAIHFQPQMLQFNSFLETKQKISLQVRADVPPGKYQIEFAKKELAIGGDFYMPVIPFTVTVVELVEAIDRRPYVEVGDIDTDTIGYPIVVRVLLSKEPANLMYLQISSSGDTENVLTITPRRILLETFMRETYFELVIKSNKVPETIMLEFKLTSFYTFIYEMHPSVKYLQFYRSTTSISNPPSLHVILSNEKKRSFETDIGKPIMNINFPLTQNTTIIEAVKQNVLPHFVEVKTVQISSNSATVKMWTTDSTYVNYLLVLDGSSPPTDLQIIQITYRSTIKSGRLRTALTFNKGSIEIPEHSAQLILDQLIPQTNYALFMIARNPLGNSIIKKFSFRTTKANFGCNIRVPISMPIEAKIIIKALSETLRIPEARFMAVTRQDELQKQFQQFNPSLMESPDLQMEVIIVPNATNDFPPPSYFCNLLNDDTYKKQLLKRLPQFDNIRKVTTSEIRKSTPKVLEKPYIKQLNHYNVTVGFKLWESGKVFAIIRNNTNSTNSTTTNSTNTKKNIPFSSQIYKGTDEANQNLNQYKKIQAQAIGTEEVAIFFDDLKDNTDYEIFITVASSLPYENPPNLYEDGQVFSIKFRTPKNPNLQFNEVDILKSVESSNPKLAKFLKKTLIVEENDQYRRKKSSRSPF